MEETLISKPLSELLKSTE